jgi:hypothetical protein
MISLPTPNSKRRLLITTKNAPAVLGFRSHSGWAAVVAVTESHGKPVILERCRIEIADPAIPGSKQPFHAAEKLDLREGETLIRKCRDTSNLLAQAALRNLIATINP